MTEYTYDLADRPATQTLPGGRVVAFTHDRNGNLTSLTPPGRTAHAFAYSNRSLLDTYTPPAIGGPAPTTYVSDRDEIVTRVVKPGNDVLDFTYDGAGRLETATQRGRPTTLRLLPAEREPHERRRGRRARRLHYDGVLVTKATIAGAAPGVIESTYDDNLQLVTQTVGGADVDYDYDDDGLPVRIGDLTLEHDAANGMLDGLGAGASATTVARNPEGEPSAVTTRQGAATTYGETYTRDDLGRITGKTETRPSGSTAWEYGFDEADRLETVERDGATVATYDYDANGNRLSVTRGATTVTSLYDAQDRLLQRRRHHVHVHRGGRAADQEGRHGGADDLRLRRDRRADEGHAPERVATRLRDRRGRAPRGRDRRHDAARASSTAAASARWRSSTPPALPSRAASSTPRARTCRT